MAVGEALGGIGQAAGTMIGLLLAGEGGRSKYREMVALWRRMQAPDFDFRELTPPQLQLVREMMPETYAAQIPREAALTQDSPEARSAQMRSLGYLEEVRDQGLTEGERLRAQDLQRSMADEHRRGQLEVFRRLAQRGRLGGGEELVGRMVANQQASELGRGFGSDLAQQALLRRMQGALASGQLGAQVRGEDVALSGVNADALNRWNEMAAQLMTGAARDAALARERAQGYNVATGQRVADTNPLLRYQTELGNLTRQNQLRGALSDFELQRAAGESAALQNLGTHYDLRRQETIGLGAGIGKGIGSGLGGIVDIGLLGGGGF